MGEKANRRNTWKKTQVFVFVCGAWMQPQVTIACPSYPRKSEVIHWWLVLPPLRVDELLLLVTRYVAGDAARWCSRTGCQFDFTCKLFGSQQCASFRLGSSQQQMQSPALRPSLFCFLCCVNSWKSVCFARHGVDTDTEPNSDWAKHCKAQWERPVVATYKANAFLLLSDARVKHWWIGSPRIACLTLQDTCQDTVWLGSYGAPRAVRLSSSN